MHARRGSFVFVSGTVAVLALCAGGAARAQAVPAPRALPAGDQSARFHAAEAAEQALQRALNGDLGFPELEPVTDGSPRDSMVFEDRRFVNQDPSAASPGDGGPTIVQVIIPAGENGTGTDKSEIMYYQLPTNYVAGNPRPMVIAWHGYGFSANSVQLQSTIDEECNARGWIYLAVTGIDDVVFGTPPCQLHAEAAIDYMTANFSVDADRLYMVGFSMGSGVVANFAARHRDPEGIMIAALGMVSSSLDWTETYVLGNSAVKTIMQNPLNFGGSVIQQLFRYQQAGTLYHAPGSFPPAPGTVVDVPSMGDNLDSLPVWMTWDTADPLVENPPVMSAQLATLISAAGGSVETHPVSGTLDPVSQLPAPHSWAVLNETALFDFFAPKTVDRSPETFKAQLDATAAVGFASATQAFANVFSFLDGDTTGNTLRIENVTNIKAVTADVGVAGLQGVWPLRVVAEAIDAGGYELRLTGFDMPPSYLVRTSDGKLVTGVESDPATGSLIVHVPGSSTLDVQVISVPWTAKLSTSPDPVAIGGGVTLTMDGTPGSAASFVVISGAELLTPIKGGWVITASLLPPSVLLMLPVNAAGDVVLAGALPNDPVLSGLRIVMQAVNLTASGSVDSVSNLWGLHVK
jgi:acetyl esterase/lipase